MSRPADPPPPQGPAGEVHIAGVLVQVRPEHLDDTATAISLLPGGEVTHATAEGKLVAVLEGPSARAVVTQLDGIRALPGVLNVALVYQHAEPQHDMDKEFTA